MRMSCMHDNERLSRYRSSSEKTTTMASPSRLLQSKRSTPIPSQLQPQSNKLSFNSLSCNNLPSLVTEVTQQRQTELLHRPVSAHTKVYDLPTDISGYTVKDYLRSRKNFLEDFMLNEVPVAVLQKVLKRKTSSRESGHEVAATVGDAIAKLKTFSTNSMMGNLSRDVQKGLPLKSILYHLCKYTAEAAYADTFQLYLVESNYLVFVAEGQKKQVKHEVCIPVRLGDTIPGYVAATKIPVNINAIKQKADFKFPKGSSLIAKDDNQVSFVLCVPILKKDEEVIGVLELGRNIKQLQFSEEDETTVQSYLSWATVAMDCSHIHKENEQSQLLFNAYNKITRLVVGDEWSFESIFECIQSTVTTLVSSENSKIFMINQSGEDLCLQLPNSSLYDTIISSESTEVIFTVDTSKQKILSQSDIVFPGLSIIKRIADYIRKTGEVLNLNDSSRKKFLDHDMDSITAVENCKTLLCAPMRINKQILGVIVAVNKTKNDEFTARDEAHFTSFCEFCSLVVSNCQSQRESNKMRLKYEVNKEVLEYHRICSSEVLKEVKSRPVPTLDTYPINKFTFDSFFLDGHTKAQLAVLMFSDLVDNFSKFDQDKVLRFFLTISKNYRSIAYHNWEHAFNVTHCMFWVIRGTEKMFSEIEKIALFIACLCHDLDHRGTNSPFLSKTDSPMAKLYSNPILENHHFSQTVALLQIKDINIFSNFTDTEYNKILSIIRKAIMASDVTQFFKNREAMLKLNSDGFFTWNNAAHKEVAQRMLITMCDLNSTFKPWPVYKAQVDTLFEEFYAQGDIEKELGYSPIEIMDRECKHKIPDIQMHFIGSFSLSSCQLLEPLMPHIETLREGAESNIARWKESRYCSIRESTCSGDNK